ncbi:MAG: glycosyltransferase family 4 protein [Flavobacteriaceae bacterium]|nr:glycosyltransferase family 4 protein [Flavobacteriaceae bacterium]
MKKRVWLVNYYAMPPQHESRLRTIKFAQYLNNAGFETKIISSSFLHNKNINLISNGLPFVKRSYNGLDFIHLRTKSYSSNSYYRFWSLLTFHFKLHFFSKRFDKPDYILHTCAPPFGLITVFTAFKLKAKYFAEVLDLWPESFLAFGLISKNNPILKISYMLEKWMYKKANKVIFSMEGGIDYLKHKKWLTSQGGKIDDNKIHYINNGVDIKDFDYNKINYDLNDTDLKNDDFFKVVYIGSVRLANNIIKLIEAASIIKNSAQIKILIYGDGDEREKLIFYCKKQNISNVIFKEKWVNPKYVPYILSKSNLNILNYSPNYIWNYGGSQSKLFQYLASGKPILSNLKMGYCLITKFNLGIAKQFNSSKDYADAIVQIANLDKKKYDDLCLNSRNIALNFDYLNLTKTFISIINEK